MHSPPLEQSGAAPVQSGAVQVPVQVRINFTIDVDGETCILSSSMSFETYALRRGVDYLAGTWSEEPKEGEVWELTGTNPATTDEGRVRFEYASLTRVYPSAVERLPGDAKGLITTALRAKAEGDNARAAEAAQAQDVGVRRLAATFTRQAAQARLLADRIEEHGLMLGEVDG